MMYIGDKIIDVLWECLNFFFLGDKWVFFYGVNVLGCYEMGFYNGLVFMSEKCGFFDVGLFSYVM